MPRYEYRGRWSAKFWTISVEGAEFTVVFGRIGTAGQRKTKTFAGAAKARAAADTLIASKLKKGYALVPEPPSEPAPPPGVLVDTRHPELEAALHAEPDNLDAWAIYADWLQGQGDVRGDLIALDLEARRASGEERTRLEALGASLLRANETQLLGGFAPMYADMKAEKRGWNDDRMVELTWAFGHVIEARIGAGFDATRDTPDMLRAFFAAPASRFGRTLRVGLPAHDGEVEFSATIAAIADTGPHESLRVLHLGDFDYPDETEISWTDVGDATPLVGACPALESLHLTGGNIVLTAFESSTLQTLFLETGGLPAGTLRAVAESQLPALHTLEVWLGAADYGAATDLAELDPLLSGERVPNLRSLGLKNGEVMDDVVRRLLGSKLLARIERLDLSMGTMSEVGARLLVDAAGQLAHLQRLDLSDNSIPDQLQAPLKAAFGPRLVFGGQGDDDGYAYVSVGE